MKLQRARLIAYCCITLLFACERIPDPRLFVENKRGQKSMEAQNFVESRDHFIAALEFDPFRPELHSNLGMGFLLSQDPEKALQSFKKSEELARGSNLEAPMKFVNRFNQGVVHSMQGRIDEALVAYQGALEVNPDSVETKTNIELLIQSQQQQQQGDGDSKDSDQNQEGDSKGNSDKSKDEKDQKQKDQNKDDQKDDKQKDNKDNKDKKDKNREYKANQKYQPREFKGEMNQSDVNKILGEIKSQEQKIRANYNKSEAKDKPREKDW